MSVESTNFSPTHFLTGRPKKAQLALRLTVSKKHRLVSSDVELLRRETDADADLSFVPATNDMELAMSGAVDDDLGAVTADDAALANWLSHILFNLLARLRKNIQGRHTSECLCRKCRTSLASSQLA